VWKLVPLPSGKIAIRTKWILKNKRDAIGIVVRNKARLVAQGHRQEEGIDYDEVSALVARIEAIRLFLAFASYMGFMHHYRRGTIDNTLFIKKDSRHIILVQVYVDDIIFGSTNKAWCDELEVLMKGEFEMSAMGEMTFLLGSMIGSLMYLTASRPDIMFALEAYSDSNYVGSHGDRKSTTGGCQFLGRRLISWQCKKQTIMATSSTKAEYVDAASCYRHVLWIQNQMSSMLRVVQVLLLVVLVRADDFVLASSCIIPAGSYSFML
nr:hypothetical protein [Tanacetum cinerariifolium]